MAAGLKASVSLRPAREDELAALTELCLRSKAHWGYDAAFLAACREEMTLRPRHLADSRITVADGGRGPLGMAQVSLEADEAVLDALFVEPAAIGDGVGRLLFDWAVGEARAGGARRLVIDSDPDAAPIYRRMGARDIGMVPSGSIPGRLLPQLVVDL
ncbi:MAG: family N-acetyltransferase [Caulobacter sp.]|nr:family N-acetyltransferase [Caulobacter sp.]